MPSSSASFVFFLCARVESSSLPVATLKATAELTPSLAPTPMEKIWFIGINMWTGIPFLCGFMDVNLGSSYRVVEVHREQRVRDETCELSRRREKSSVGAAAEWGLLGSCLEMMMSQWNAQNDRQTTTKKEMRSSQQRHYCGRDWREENGREKIEEVTR